MVIYIDILLVLNLIINYFLLSAVTKLLKEEVKRKRLVLSALFGAFYSLVILLPSLGIIISNLLKVAASAVMILIAFGRIKPKAFLKRMLCFYIIGALFAGIMYALYFFISPFGMEYSNGVVYFNISAPLLVLSIGGIYLLLVLFQKLFMQSSSDSSLSKLRVYLNGRSAVIWGFKDTGNSLKDPITGVPVAVCSYDSLKRLFKEHEDGFFGGNIENIVAPYRLVPYSSVGRNGLLPAFSPERIEIYNNNGWADFPRMMIAVCPEMPAEYDCILPSTI